MKVWTWIKIIGISLAIIILAIVCVIFFRKSNILEQTLQVVTESYKKQMAEIERLNKEEKEKKEALQIQYDALVKMIEEKYKLDNKVLDEAKKDKVKELTKQYQDNPEEMTNAIKKAFGL